MAKKNRVAHHDRATLANYLKREFNVASVELEKASLILRMLDEGKTDGLVAEGDTIDALRNRTTTDFIRARHSLERAYSAMTPAQRITVRNYAALP